MIKYLILFAINGNKLLKYIEWKHNTEKGITESIEQLDTYSVILDILVSRKTVNLFKDKVKKRQENKVRI